MGFSDNENKEYHQPYSESLACTENCNNHMYWYMFLKLELYIGENNNSNFFVDLCAFK